MVHRWRLLSFLVAVVSIAAAQEAHDHPAPEILGKVSFPVSCNPAVQAEFNRGVALLHSFAYTAAAESFRAVADQDPNCALAHWGIAMTSFHQLWEPQILPAAALDAERELLQAQHMSAATERERMFINAAFSVFHDAASVPYERRALKYEQGMSELAQMNKGDVESQVFYALALLADSLPTDKTHANQKKAIAILQPIYRMYPNHPGVAHYLIHACDNTELASQGLSVAREYAKIAPSVPHALHMPSHIFTRLGLWEDSIASNTAARNAAHQQGDIGEELHAMDYLVYAYLQLGRDADAAHVIEQLKQMPISGHGDFKVSYAATAMPVRYLVERSRWTDATGITSPQQAPPQVAAIAVWAQGLGSARTGHAVDARRPIERLQQIEDQLHAAANEYWATQVRVMRREVMAWSAQSEHHAAEAEALMRQAADEEDSVEKLPVTPGPIVPAREQLGDLLLAQGHPQSAAREFRLALISAPGRLGSLRGAAEAAAQSRLHPQ